MSMRITSNLLRATRATRNCPALTNQARNFCVRTLFVGNIPYVSNETHLQECFGNFGKIDKIHMPKGPDGNHKGYGFVSFIVGERPTPNEDGTPKIVIPTDQEIQEAEKLVSRVIQKVSGLDYMGRTLRVDYASNDSAGSKKIHSSASAAKITQTEADRISIPILEKEDSANKLRVYIEVAPTPFFNG